MNEQNTPKSMRQSIWKSARTKNNRRLWNYVRKSERGKLPELSPVLKKLSFRGDKYKMGPYEGTLEELREFAAFKGMPFLQVGAIKYKTH
jgi:mannose/fructose/N-acetylgalactosamine-specific phosphotransferase system component IID